MQITLNVASPHDADAATIAADLRAAAEDAAAEIEGHGANLLPGFPSGGVTDVFAWHVRQVSTVSAA